MSLKFIDLFAGIGGFRLAAERASAECGLVAECVFSSEIDKSCREQYAAYFGEEPAGDITKINASDIPDFDLLLAGFPCQPFSIIGKKRGFDDARGTLFFDIARILKKKTPRAFVLENVKMLVGHDKGRTLQVILRILEELDYTVDFKVLNALDYGLPQKRERIFLVGFREKREFKWPGKLEKYKPLSEILEKDVPEKYFASDYIVQKRKEAHRAEISPSIWHENKSGNISSRPFSCALRSGASHNYLLVDGVRRLTPREQLRLQGFPDDFKIVVGDFQIKSQTGNAVPVDLAQAVLREAIKAEFAG